MLVGPVDVGKSTVCRILLNYAVSPNFFILVTKVQFHNSRKLMMVLRNDFTWSVRVLEIESNF